MTKRLGTYWTTRDEIRWLKTMIQKRAKQGAARKFLIRYVRTMENRDIWGNVDPTAVRDFLSRKFGI